MATILCRSFSGSRIPLVLAGTAFLLASSQPPFAPTDVRDSATRQLIERARSSLHPTAPMAVQEAAAPNVLWTHQAADNAACVRGGDDVDGNGALDAIAGHDISGSNHTLFALSGDSTGVANVVWSIETLTGASGGSFWGDDSVSIASDVTGDGVRDILGATAWGGRSAFCFDASDGSVVWFLDTYNTFDSGWVYTIHEMPDVTGDGVPEVIFGCGSDNNSVYCMSGASLGANPPPVWSFQAFDAVFAVTWVPDVSGDGLPDVVAGTGDNDDRMYCLSGADGTVLWIHDPGGTVYSLDTIQDVDGDGVRDIVAATWTGGAPALCVSSATGNQLWAQPAVGGFGMKVAPLADHTGDGIDEVLVGSWNNAIQCLDGATGAIRWTKTTGPLNGGDVWTVSSIPDVNGDGFADALGGSFDTHVYCCDGTDGTVLWAQGTGNRVYSVSWLGDVNGDGKPEALAGTQDTNNNTLVYAIEGDSGLVPPYVKLTGSGQIGTSVTVHTTGLPGDEFILLLAFGTGNVPIPPWGSLLLDPASLFVLNAGSIEQDGTDNTPLPIPANPVFVGVPLYFQSLVGSDFGAGVGAFTGSVQVTMS